MREEQTSYTKARLKPRWEGQTTGLLLQGPIAKSPMPRAFLGIGSVPSEPTGEFTTDKGPSVSLSPGFTLISRYGIMQPSSLRACLAFGVTSTGGLSLMDALTETCEMRPPSHPMGNPARSRVAFHPFPW